MGMADVFERGPRNFYDIPCEHGIPLRDPCAACEPGPAPAPGDAHAAATLRAQVADALRHLGPGEHANAYCGVGQHPTLHACLEHVRAVLRGEVLTAFMVKAMAPPRAPAPGDAPCLSAEQAQSADAARRLLRPVDEPPGFVDPDPLSAPAPEDRRDD